MFPYFVFSLSRASTFLSLSTCSLSCSSTSMVSKPPRNKTTALTHKEECCPVAIHIPLTGYEPKLFDNFDYSEISAVIFQDETGDMDTQLLMKKVCWQLSSFSHTQVRGDPYTNLVRHKNENLVATWKTKESGFPLKDKKSKFSLKSDLRSRSSNFKSDRRSIQELTGIIYSQRREIDHTIRSDENLQAR